MVEYRVEEDWLDGGRQIAVREEDTRLDWRKRRKQIIARRSEELAAAANLLTIPERVLAELLVQHLSTREAYAEYRERFGPTPGYELTRMKTRLAKYIRMAQEHAIKNLGLNKASVLLNLEKIRDESLEPQPIVDKDGAIVGYERDYNAALRALDQQSKVLSLYTDDNKPTTAVQVNISFGEEVEAPTEAPLAIGGEPV